MTRRRWSDLSGRQRAAIVAAAVVQEALAAATLWDLRHRPSAQIRGSKKLWVAAAPAGRPTVPGPGGPHRLSTGTRGCCLVPAPRPRP